jgi:type I restriction enzyme S subunit
LGASQGNLNVNNVRAYIIPVPPLSEQHRIVAKADQLMKICDQLEQQIEQSTDKRTQLLNAILSNIQ